MNPVVKILNTIGDVYTQGAKEILEEVGDVDYKILTQDNLLESIGEYEIAVIGLGLSFMKDVLEKAEKLKIIATATTGLDHIDVKFAKLKGITVLSLRGENDFLDTITGTAELAWGLLIDVVRLTPWAFDNVKEYKWEREKFRGHNLYGKTLGIVGMGRLGKWMARYGKAFGMNVLYCDPNINLSTSDVDRLWKRVEFGELLENSDVVSVHVHLTSETENMFSPKTISQMKKGAYLINTSRGKIVDEGALLGLLKNGHLGGYGREVLEDELYFEKGFKDHPLVEYAKGHKNVVIVPHIGGMTIESRERTDIFIAEKIKRFVQK